MFLPISPTPPKNMILTGLPKRFDLPPPFLAPFFSPCTFCGSAAGAFCGFPDAGSFLRRCCTGAFALPPLFLFPPLPPYFPCARHCLWGALARG